MRINFNSKLYIATLILAIASSCSAETKSNSSKAEQVATKTEEPTKIEKPAKIEQKSPSFNMELYFKAALDGNIATIKDALDAGGVDVNAINEQKQTALMLTSFNGHLEIIQLLVSKGANVEMLDVNNRTALMYASTGPFNSSVEFLLKSGAQTTINAVDNVENWTALMFAAGEGQMEVIKTLIAAGADVKMLDVDGESSYDFAVAKNHPEAANYLKSLE